jgi:hypothetical protein
MSTPLTTRRSNRVPSQPARYAEQQASYAIHDADAALMRRAQQLSLQSDDPNESDEDALAIDGYSSSEDDSDEKGNISPNSSWTQQTHDITVPAFTIPSGPNLPRQRLRSELGYLQCFLTEELVSTIAINTNLYAISKHAAAEWSTTASEIWRFIAVHIFMGIVDLPSVHMYWEAGWRQSYVVEAFSRDRFTELLRYFHIAEPTPAGVRHTVIDKIKPLHDLCLSTFSEYYIPPVELTVDESMVRFKGRCGWKTVIKGKPTPIGYKLYTVGSHGYLLNFQVYKGKGGYAVEQGVIHHVVVDIVQRWAHSNRILFTDNLYTSPALCRHLLSIGLRSCGTVRTNRRHLPLDLKDSMKALKPGEMKAWQSGQLGCLLWYDRQPVVMLSNHHRVDVMVTVEKDRGPDQPPTITRPKVSVDYNLHKCHVDTVDQLRQYYAMQRKSMKNWPSLAWWLIDMCIINAYTLWCLDTNTAISQLDFRKTLLQQLFVAYPSSAIPRHRTYPPIIYNASDPHLPTPVSNTRDCVHCSDRLRQRKRTKIECDRCHVHLCVTPCFKQYHILRQQGD